MENGFEDYLAKNRDKFEEGGPPPAVWEKLEAGLKEHHRRKAKVVRIQRIRWAVAASIILGLSAAFFLLRKPEAINKVVKNPAPVQKNIVPIVKNKHTVTAQTQKIAAPAKKRNDDELALTGSETRQSIYYYTRLIEINQKQFQRLQAIDPELYRESQKSIEDLNKVYIQLKSQLSGSINQERVLESMIENLRMQEQILDNQLQIIREVESKIKNDGTKVKEI
jgi:hypothetical protein